MDTWSVCENYLRLFVAQYPEPLLARRIRSNGYGCQVIPKDLINKSRFSHIRSTKNSHKTNSPLLELRNILN